MRSRARRPESGPQARPRPEPTPSSRASAGVYGRDVVAPIESEQTMDDSALVPALSEISRIVAETLELPQVFQRVAEVSARLIRFDVMTVTLRQEDELV